MSSPCQSRLQLKQRASCHAWSFHCVDCACVDVAMGRKIALSLQTCQARLATQDYTSDVCYSTSYPARARRAPLSWQLSECFCRDRTIDARTFLQRAVGNDNFLAMKQFISVVDALVIKMALMQSHLLLACPDFFSNVESS